MQFTKTFESVDVRFGSAGPLLLALYSGTTSLEMLDALDRTQETLLKTYKRISTLTVIGQVAHMLKMHDGVRARSVELGKKYEKNVVGSAIVVTTKGLGAVMVRTFLSGFFLLSRSETPMRTFSKISDGLSWLQSLPEQDLQVKTQITSADIERFIA